jgi:hypothetical protein
VSEAGEERDQIRLCKAGGSDRFGECRKPRREWFREESQLGGCIRCTKVQTDTIFQKMAKWRPGKNE